MEKDEKQKLIRIISIIEALLFLILIIVFVSFLLISKLVENIESLMNNIPILADKAEACILNLVEKYPKLRIEMENTFHNIGSANVIISEWQII